MNVQYYFTLPHTFFLLKLISVLLWYGWTKGRMDIEKISENRMTPEIDRARVQKIQNNNNVP